MDITIVLAVLVTAGVIGVGVAVYLLIRSKIDGNQVENAKELAKGVLTQAEEEKRSILLSAQEEVLNLRTEGERDIKEQRQELNRLERRYLQREEQLEVRNDSLEKQQTQLTEQQDLVQRTLKETEELKVKQLEAIEETASLSVAEARDIVITRGEEEAQHDLSRKLYAVEKEHQSIADENARRIITLAINRLATDVVSETTTSVVSLPSDDMKGRLIGREGRNIRALESLTGVDVVIDDTPEIVTISCFDPVRREIARLALEKLIADGRIQPARIEDMVNLSLIHI